MSLELNSWSSMTKVAE